MFDNLTYHVSNKDGAILAADTIEEQNFFATKCQVTKAGIFFV